MNNFDAHILVVDDDERIRELVKQYLNQNNFLVTTAKSSEDAENKIKIVLTELAFDNVRDKYLSFSDLEKYLLPNNYRLVGIDLENNNLFSGLVFFAEVMYFNKKFFDI